MNRDAYPSRRWPMLDELDQYKRAGVTAAIATPDGLRQLRSEQLDRAIALVGDPALRLRLGIRSQP